MYSDPRWGRIEETPGEDPYLNGEYAYAFTKGFQEGYSEGPSNYLKAYSEPVAFTRTLTEHRNTNPLTVPRLV